MKNAQVAPPASGLRRAACVLLGAQIVLAAVIFSRSIVLVPVADQIDWLQRWLQLNQGRDAWSYLLEPHNHHRIVWTLALQAFDLSALGGDNIPLVTTGIVGVAAMTWLLAREAATAAGAVLKLPAATLAAMLMLNAAILMDASMPVFVAGVHGAVLSLLAILLGERKPATRGWRAAGALACAAAAGLGNAAALVVWPVLAWGALRRRDWTWLGLVVTCGGLYILGYAHGQSTEGSPLGALANPVQAAKIALGCLVLPWTRLAQGYGWIAGLAVFVLALTAMLLRGGRGAPAWERVACGLILFGLGAAGMAGLGRTDLVDPSNVPVRYTVFIAPMHIGLAMLTLRRAETLLRARPRAAQAVVLGVLGVMLLQNAVMGYRAIETTARIRTEVADFLQGRAVPEASDFPHRDRALAARVYTTLKHEGLFRRQLGGQDSQAKH